MFERYLAEALASHFRHIISDFDADKVKFSVWNGEVILRDLTLKEDAIQQLEGGSDLPFKISYGHIGTFELRIPWNLLGLSKRTKKRENDETTSCSVILSDVNVLISPGSSQKVDGEGDEDEKEKDPREERIKKERMVQNLLDEALFRKNIELVGKDDANAEESFVKKLITNVLSSLTVTVRNVHIRYEDPGDCLGFESNHQFGSKRKIRHRPPFAVGIALEEFRLANTEEGPQEDDELYRIPDIEGISTQSNESKSGLESELYSIQHKLAAAKALSIYWDSDISSNELIHLRVQKIERRRKHGLRRSHTSTHSSEGDSEHETTMGKNIENDEFGNDAETDSNEVMGDQLFSTLLAKALKSQSEGRAYIIQPSSPSLQFSVVSTFQSERGGESENYSVPASRAVLTLPPSQMNITKDTLEDIAYFRRSFGLWKEMRTSLLTRKIYAEITKARPQKSPLENPRGWWQYAFEAVKTLSRIENENENRPGYEKKGWAGLIQSLKARKLYLSLHETLLDPNTPEKQKEELNNKLCSLEDTLEPSEIVALRVDALRKNIEDVRSKRYVDDRVCDKEGVGQDSSWWLWRKSRSIDANPKDNLQHVLFDEQDMLTAQYRQTVYSEIMATMEVEEDLVFGSKEFESEGVVPLKDNINTGSRFELTVLSPQIILQVDDIVTERSSSVHSQSIGRRRPVVQVICASVQKVRFHRNTMWDITSTFASLEMLDLLENHSSLSECPRLITRKRSWVSQVPNSDTNDEYGEKSVIIGGESYSHGGTICVKKTVDFENPGQSNSVVTTINIKLSPMEIVYSPDTVQILSKVFSTTKTSELAVDYQRLKRMFSNWQAKQKQRLIEVLVRKERRVVTNIDIAAPVFFMHDKTSNGTLVADLGRLSLRDVNEASKKSKGYDNTWELSLQNIQLFSMPRPDKVSTSVYNLVSHGDTCQLVEPFSLEFIISTRFVDGDSQGLTSQVLIDATLPRLVFNFSSSAVRLVHRLSMYRKIRKSRYSPRPRQSQKKEFAPDGPASFGQGQEGNRKTVIDFKFSAPLIALRLTNDVDGRDCGGTHGMDKTQIAELVIRGIGGELSRTFIDGYKSSTIFNARLKSVLAEDLYQEAGQDFSKLLSSQCPTNNSERTVHNPTLKKECPVPLDSDLVCVKYDDCGAKDTGRREKKLSIELYELYVEWNPETFAAIQKSLRLSTAEKDFFAELERGAEPNSPMRSSEVAPSFSMRKSYSIDDSVAFFDAVEEEYACTLSDEDIFLSEASSDEDGSNDNLFNLPNQLSSPILSPIVVKAMRAISMRDSHLNDELDTLLQHSSVDKSVDCPPSEIPKTMFAVKFQLSKLRVRFNKESRLRRLVVAEMNETLIQYRTKPSGGTRTVANFGNFTLLDPCKYDGSTLYGEILGLKTDADRSESMLEITRETFPRNEDDLYGTCSDDTDVEVERNATPCQDEKNLSIDQPGRCISGCDTFLTMHFSPMRFVLLQQLWLEMADYFFEGIVGYEVWGRTRPGNHSAADVDQQRIQEEIMSSHNDKALYGEDANDIKFLRFRITMDSPVIVLPVTYRSPQHLRFDLDGIHIENKHRGEIKSLEQNPKQSAARYVQWYNNCNIDFQGLRLNSWCGTQLNISNDPKIHIKEDCENRIPMTISVKWPIGPTAFTIVPKWNFHCYINNLRLLFRKKDFALFQHIIWYNIGEESRHLDEWNALQNLPPDQLIAHKNKMMVNFGYDKKDGPPTTFHFKVDITSVILHFCLDENNHVADVEGSNMRWSLKKVKDRISRQSLTFNSIRLSQTSGKEAWAGYQSLLFPLKRNVGSEVEEKPQLVYKSTSRPCGDNVKLLVVNHACIYFIFPAWMFVKSFFQNLPDPDVMSQEEVLGSIQIDDRWYRIDTGMPKETMKNRQRGGEQRPILKRKPADFQLRIVLESPKIVLAQDSSSLVQKGRAVTLGLGHLDFFHHNNPRAGSIQKTLFLHDLEVFTGSDDVISGFDEKTQQRSLLYPLCAGVGIISQYSDGILIESKKWLSSDVVSFRAAYTDMTLAIDVFQKILSDIHDVKDQSHVPKAESESIHMDSDTSKDVVQVQVKESVGAACGGFDLLVIDDSGRHFAGTQELVQLSISGILYKISKVPDSEEDFLSVMRLQLHGVELADCLQPSHSPFRVVAIGNNLDADGNDTSSLRNDKKKRWLSMNKKVFSDFMHHWDTHCMMESVDWGYIVSDLMQERCSIAFKSEMRKPFNDSNLIDIHHKILLQNRHEYRCAVGKVVLQWNPSMAIALQRFLGRLRKDVTEKQLASQSIAEKKRAPSREAKGDIQYRDAEIEIESITLCLNKEHQHRRLLQITISNAFVAFQRDEYCRLTVQGSIGDLNAWDSDGNRKGQVPICRENRLVVGVLHNPADLDDSYAEVGNEDGKNTSNLQRLLTLNYYSTPSEAIRSKEMQHNFKELRLPDWVVSQVGRKATIESVDDCLSLSIATVRFNHIRERTGEIMDYLSNGIPGKSMGATSRAAKGFITKRIKTKSFTNLNVNSPQLFLPCHRGNEEGVIVCLGDVRLKSWFDEATLDESKDIDCNDLVRTQIPVHNQVPMTPRLSTENDDHQKYWWRILSVSILGLGWRVNRKEGDIIPTFSQIENPLNVHLQVRRPPSHSQLPVIVRCKMTAMETVLTYTEYMFLNAVLKENLTKKVDKTLWDNPEDISAYDEDPASGVKYSKNARFVRYGKMSGRHSTKSQDSVGATSSTAGKNSTSIDIKFSLDGVVLILHRDDIIPIMEEDGSYDIVRLEVDDIDLHMASNADGSKIGTVKLQSFTLLDVGDVGRIAREKFHLEDSTNHDYSSISSKIRRPSLFSVIAEGYDTEDEHTNIMSKQDKEPQLIITFDTGSSTSIGMEPFEHDGKSEKVTSIRVTLNHLNINPLVRPLSEVGDFFSGAWTVDNVGINLHGGDRSIGEDTGVSGPIETPDPEEYQPTASQQATASSIRAVHLTVITNYPRVFLVADETDPLTKALVLRGLTVLNATMVNQTGSEVTSKSTTVSIRGQVHSLESYINPDPRNVLEKRSVKCLSFALGINERKEMDTHSEVNDFLGVALIEPVTASFTLLQIKRSNFPTVREVFVSMEPVSTTLSFEDMKLIEVVLSRWKNERDLVLRASSSVDPLRNASNELDIPTFISSGGGDVHDSEDTRQSRSFSNGNESIISISESLHAENDVSFCGDCIPTDNFCISDSGPEPSEERVFTQPHENSTFDVVFSGQKLGLALRKRESFIVVEEVLDTAIRDKLKNGDVLISIEADLVSGLPFQAVLNLINKTKRPMKITFRRMQARDHIPVDSVADAVEKNLHPYVEVNYSNEIEYEVEHSLSNFPEPEPAQGKEVGPQTLRKSYVVSLVKGVDNSIEIEKSMCGDVAIVSKVSSKAFADSCVHHDTGTKYFPKPGSVIIAVNGEAVLTKGFKGTSEFLQNCKKEASGVEETFTLTFLDATADDWGAVDKVDIVVAGIKLTLIDDINGRDMPLLQGTLQSLAIKMERGLGLDCNFIKVSPPSILMAEEAMKYSLDSPSINEVPVISDLTEVITKVCANVEIQLDYYNARIAVWEPLVESSCLSTEFESQRGNRSTERPRPGAFSIAISDNEGPDADSAKQPYVCINISDSAADLLFTALYEWRAWRKMNNKGAELSAYKEETTALDGTSSQSGMYLSLPQSPHVATESRGDESYSYSTSPQREWQLADDSTQNGAAQNAAQAALIFARRRGVESQKSEDSKPFIFRNQTGMTISFLPEVQGDKESERREEYAKKTAYNLKHDRKLAITTIQDGKEASFDLETTDNYKNSDSSNRNANKVRSYDGQFPLLSVNFHTTAKDIHVEILQHMSVVRIGDTMKSLRVKTSGSREGGKTASILVVWSVALENNRRILTLSSAVRVSSPRCGIPIEVGVRRIQEISQEGHQNYDEIESVGTSSSSNVCYLPLWLQLSFKATEVFIRPLSKSNSFQWSTTSILRLEKLTFTTSLTHQRSNYLWSWTLSDHSTSITCEPVNTFHSHPSAFLSYECIYETPSLSTQVSDDFYLPEFPDHEYQMKCIDICSILSLRNVLPTSLEWEIVEAGTLNHVANSVPLDGSFIRSGDTQLFFKREGTRDGMNGVGPIPIPPGHGTDVFACDLATMNIGIKVRCDADSEWSECVPINYIISKDGLTRLPLQEPNEKDQQTQVRHHGGSLFNERTLNAQSYNKFGSPLTFGIKVNPRIAQLRQNENATHNGYVIGFDLLVYSEIWIKNLTALPILFGVPSTQIDYASSQGASLHSMHEPLRKKAAEAALSELSNILEFGEIGNEVGDRDVMKEILALSKQESMSTAEEVFEYKEMENEKVLRHWWAGEYHAHVKPEVTSFGSLEGTEWIWTDKSWNLDTSGGCKASQGCWESCTYLTSARDSSFSPLRTFNRTHRFRRRRWFRHKEKPCKISSDPSDDRISSFHQPALDMSTRSRRKQTSKDKQKSINAVPETETETEHPLEFHFKVGDGGWSSPAVVPTSGAAHGILRIPASRWPALAKSEEKRSDTIITGNSMSVGLTGLSTVSFHEGSLSTKCFDVCYRVAPIEGQWGDHSRVLVLYPRFYIRNDSDNWYMDVKQAGTPDKCAIRIKPASSKAFYWVDTSLPDLMCVRPAFKNNSKVSHKCHCWSGGFDITSLGMIPLMIQRDPSRMPGIKKYDTIAVVRALVELRSGTGGTGISVSIKEELTNGEDSLYRLENHSPFPLWIVQDGILANPGRHDTRNPTGSNIQIIEPKAKVPYGLVNPFRQGKYAGRKAVPLEELLRLRVGLAPLATRDGIESTKVISLSYVGATMRLKPAKLRTFFDEETIADMMNVNVQGIVSSDGPTRVLKFTLIERNLTASSVIKNSVRMHTDGLSNEMKHDKDIIMKLKRAAETATSLLRSQALQKYDPSEEHSTSIYSQKGSDETITDRDDCNYSFRASFRGFVFSLVDKFPSEVGVITIRNIHAMSEWNAHRSKESTAALSVGLMQIDNHCPNAPFPVVLCPTPSRDEDTEIDVLENERPFLSIGIVLAPRHKSDITCLKGVTISLNDISLSTDLAFVLRVQHQLLGIVGHIERNKEKHDIGLDPHSNIYPKDIWQFPDFSVIFSLRNPSYKIGYQKMYLEGLTILPFTIKLSVAPSVALTSAQAALEGVDAGAIHAAVRKGDLLIGDKADGVVGVKIGSKNRTAMAVIRGIFKSILVDSLLRCDDVSMNFSGLAVRNHLSTMKQLKTFIGHHYLSLLKNNVPALIGSLAAFGNPVGLIRGFGDGVTDFVSEPIKGFKRSVEELDPSYVMDGVARGTGSLARHTVGGIVDSASLLTETFSKNMAVLTLDRKYAQRRDRFKVISGTNTTFVGGVESGVGKLLRGVAEGVIGVVRAPMRGAEKRGVEGFAKGVGKGLLGLVVKPVIGISDAATDVMVGVKGSLEGVGNKAKKGSANQSQVRPRRAFYGRDRRLKPYVFVDAISAAIMMRTRLGGDNYLSHVDMGGRVAILSVKRFLLLGDDGEQQLLIKLKNIKRIDLRRVPKSGGGSEWGVLIFLKTARNNGNEVEVVTTPDKGIAKDICAKIQQGITLLD